MKWLTGLLLIVVLLMGAVSEAKTYRHYGHQLQITVPDDWEIVEHPGNGFIVMLIDPDLRYEVNAATILQHTLPPRYTLTDYVNNTILNQSKMLWQYQLVSKDLVDHSYGPCYQLVFHWRLSWEQQYYVKQMIISRYPEVYVLTATAPFDQQEAYDADFSKIISSFAFFN